VTSIPKVLSPIGEAATAWIRTSREEYVVSPRPVATGRVLRSPTALGTYDIANSRAQSYFLRIVSIAEAYTDAALETMFHLVVPSTSVATVRLLELHLLDATQNWDGRKRSFMEHHGLSLGDRKEGFPDWSKFDGMIEVRNAIAHGLGTLTRQQRRNPLRTASRCSQIGVRIEGGEIVVRPENVSAAAAIGEAFVRWLDAKL
jgi:hypothetical protein